MIGTEKTHYVYTTQHSCTNHSITIVSLSTSNMLAAIDH